MLKVVDIDYIRKKHFIEGWGIRKISRQLCVSRQSVRKALNSAEKLPYSLKSPKPCPVMDPHRDTIIGWLTEDKVAPRKQRHTAHRIYERLCDERDFKGSESTVRHFVRKLRAELEEPNVEAFFVLKADPGEMAQVDWGQAVVFLNDVETKIHLFCMRLRASSVPFVWATVNERLEAFLEGHVRGLEWFGGVPEKLVYDNLPTAVKKVLSGHQREEQERFITLRSHYLFESVFCNTASGWEKGSVENLVGHVRRNALTPRPYVQSLEELNAKLLKWCDRERQKHSAEWNAEAEGLRPLPVDPFKPCVRSILSVNRLSLVTCHRNRYSVPVEYINQAVRVDLFTDKLEIWQRDNLIAVHERYYGRGHTSLQFGHFLPALARKPYAVFNAAVVRQLPEPFQKAREMLCKQDSSGYREFVHVLQLHNEFSRDEIKLALLRGIHSGHVSYADIRQVLLNERDGQANECSEMKLPDRLRVNVAIGDPGLYNTLKEVNV